MTSTALHHKIRRSISFNASPKAMSAYPPARTEQLPLPAWANDTIERQLRAEFPFCAIAAALAPLTEQSRAAHERQRARRDALRSVLEALPLSELEALRIRQYKLEAARQAEAAQSVREREARAAAEAAAKEAAKFYNQPQACADFAHWGKMEYWTFDEALALLLGKDPRIVSRAAMNRELSPGIEALFFDRPAEKSGFVRSYENLRQLAERASAMQGPRLRPANVLLWAHDSGAATLAPALLKAVVARPKPPQPVSPAATIPTPTPTPTPSVATNTEPALDERAGSESTEPEPDTMSRKELVRKYQSCWPDIASDLKNTGTNGLAKLAKTDRHGYWDVAKALEWARANHRLQETRATVRCTANASLPAVSPWHALTMKTNPAYA